ncbi:very short patch repair endonuclease [Desulfovibrio aminophilus]|nr:very short patch repair endonuclease [Desulfovibrio aminophilus]MCM0754772.1 very short patch repair endonuclease [Desulfovibrio aminophilus]
MDTLTPRQRSERMSRVRGKDTAPEMRLRKLIHGMGYRYRLHVGNLPGRPDLVFSSRRKVIFLHGCFWHRHPDRNCKLARLPKSRQEFWLPKLEGNKARDHKVLAELRAGGWDVLVIWECEMNRTEWLQETIRNFLDRERRKQ